MALWPLKDDAISGESMDFYRFESISEGFLLKSVHALENKEWFVDICLLIRNRSDTKSVDSISFGYLLVDVVFEGCGETA